MRPKGSAEELERRRRRAVQLMREGESPTLIARILGVSRQSLYRWRDMAQAGPKGLAAKPPHGRKRRLNDAQLQQLEKLLLKGAQAHGWANNLWTAPSCNRGDSPAFRNKTSPRTRPQHSEATVGLDQPEARTQSPRTRRERNCSVAPRRISAYKKTPLGEALTWFSPMNRVSCSLLPFAEPWPLEARHPFTTAGIDGTASRPSVPSPLVPFANAGDCTLPCWKTMRMFTLRMWSAFCVSLSIIFRARLRLSGTVVGCMIAPKWCRRIWPNIRKLSPRNFRPMHQNSTQTNRFGRTLNMLACPITPRTTLGNFAVVLRGNSSTCASVLTCWLPSYIMQKSLLGFKQCLFI